jgi:hypothetical protein
MKTLVTILAGWLLFSAFQTKADQPVAELNAFMDKWHQAAAKADMEGYFAETTDDFIFLGTDPTERWDKEQFKAFCKPYFDKGQGWEFTSTERNWVFSSNNKIAWFDEKLDTWMQECRGSGIMVREGKKWKLAYYNLTVLIENDKIQDFIELRKK